MDPLPRTPLRPRLLRAAPAPEHPMHRHALRQRVQHPGHLGGAATGQARPARRRNGQHHSRVHFRDLVHQREVGDLARDLRTVRHPQVPLQDRQGIARDGRHAEGEQRSPRVAQRGDLAVQEVRQCLVMPLDPPATAVGLAALEGRDLGRQVRHQHDLRLTVPRRLVQLQHDPAQAVDATVPVGDVDRLLEDLTRGAASARPQPSGRLERQRRAVPADQEERVPARDPEDQRTDAEVAVDDPELAGLDVHAVDQGPLLAVGVFLEDQVEDQSAGRLVDRQRHAGQAGRPGRAQRRDAVLGPGQDVAIEDPRGIASDRLGHQAAGGDDELARAAGGAADDALGEGQFHAVELAAEGRVRGDELEVPPQEGRPRRGSVPAGDVEHHLDEVGQGELAGILMLGDLLEELVEGCAVDDPVQGDPGHDGGRSALDKGIEDRWENQRSLLGQDSNPE
jgi:hypothetical protein